uniref:Uncharacterized protein n=1 Tax=Aplanochytrium stocchinoi TaxID=215587 RepID=A0A7S3V2H6_9STRA|mmetsp:Transcript_13353/g.16619  ORF Transcript_13353/g.16619 Transcript_13353/m.16619 type:complete len:250 (+) Transcript_13353:147-896(+)|eukprot:CAMPEP_0204827688 /NCGR_PEP_ID=MMETSP1346-20131115/5122_1 /ASSEMBLY_ACC=CAM_ASM_000771 /TAXON_ID=215587 /ORGANISM="Aplanochytrium stocchinoi, Strain GSBS06" /LENGTH=249 /DNA_ID=CAMNT_0051956205 /DNA_START=147 /DNA_END=896 /DNA_ORIENTATION=-
MSDWKVQFSALCEKAIPEQRDVFLNRFALQIEKSGEDTAKAVVKLALSAADMFTEKAKSSDGRRLQYGGVEFGDVYSEFCGDNMTFIERKKVFAPFDLDNNGYIDLIEFLLYFYREPLLKGYKARNAVDAVESEAEALMQELVMPALYIDSKLDANLLGLKQLEEAYVASVESAKKEAQEGGGVKKVQLGGNLQKLENKFKEDQKGFMSPDAIAKKKAKVVKQSEEAVAAMKAELEKEDADARGPSKKK